MDALYGQKSPGAVERPFRAETATGCGRGLLVGGAGGGAERADPSHVRRLSKRDRQRLVGARQGVKGTVLTRRPASMRRSEFGSSGFQPGSSVRGSLLTRTEPTWPGWAISVAFPSVQR